MTADMTAHSGRRVYSSDEDDDECLRPTYKTTGTMYTIFKLCPIVDIVSDKLGL